MMLKILPSLMSLALLWRCRVDGLDNGIALTPPMGFNTWLRYKCTVDIADFPGSIIGEDLIQRIAYEMKHGGYLDAGYEFLVIDDCWMSRSRSPSGDLVEDEERFPNGMSKLIDYVKQMGLKFGIYENHGKVTCMGYPGTIGKYVKRDAELFVKWKVDFVKLDGCFTPLELNDAGYPEFGKYLNLSGRPIVYSCSWPYYQFEKGVEPNYASIMKTCNLWRNYFDVQDDWKSVVDIVRYYGTNQNHFAKFHGSGHWHDGDMLVIGNRGLSYEQAKTQMAMWCVIGLPLFMSTDLMAIRPEFKEILLNRVAIGIDQDPFGKMGRQIYDRAGIQIWTKEIIPQLACYSSYAIVIVNFRPDGTPIKISQTASQLGLYNPKGYVKEDVFRPGKTDVFEIDQILSAEIQPNSAVFWKLTAIGPDVPEDPRKREFSTTSCVLEKDEARTSYAMDVIGVIYLGVMFAMLIFMIKSRTVLRRQRLPLSTI